jgi:hypothetical protein
VATADGSVVEFNHPAADYIGWMEGIGPGCALVVDQLRQGSTQAFADVIQQFLFANPDLGEHLHDELEEADMEGRLLDECDVPEEIVESYYNEPTVQIKFMDTMEEAVVDYSHGIILRAVDLANYSVEIEEIAMTMKTLEENMKTLQDDMKRVLEKMGSMDARVQNLESNMATKDWLNLRFAGLLLLTFLGGLGVLKWETLTGLFAG